MERGDPVSPAWGQEAVQRIATSIAQRDPANTRPATARIGGRQDCRPDDLPGSPSKSGIFTQRIRVDAGAHFENASGMGSELSRSGLISSDKRSP